MPEHIGEVPDGSLLAVGESAITGTLLPLGAERDMASAEAMAGDGVETPSSSQRSGGLLAPLRLGSFRLLIGGQTVSRVGDAFFSIAIPWLVLRVTHEPLALSLVVGSMALTTGLFTLVGGVLADRLGPRALMLGSDIVRLGVMAALAAVALLTTPTLWELVVLVALLGVATGLFFPSAAAMIPFLVTPADLQAANGIEQLSSQSSNFAGPAIAGVVLSATQVAFGLVLDAVSFAISVVTLLFVRVPPRPRREESADASRKGGLRSGIADLADAFRFLRRTPFLLTMVSLSVVANFGIIGLFEVALPLTLKDMVGIENGPRALGVIASGLGLGSILGAVAAGAAGKLPHKALIAVLLLLPIGGLVGYVPFAGNVYLMAGLFAAMGLLLGASNVLFITVMQRFIPLEMMGRLMSIIMLGSFAGGPLSIFVYGALATVVPQVGYLFLGGAAIFFIACIAALSSRYTWQTQ
jgi:MFS family permease